MNKQEALEYAKKTMVCPTCVKKHNFEKKYGKCPLIPILSYLNVLSAEECGPVYQQTKFGCIYYKGKDETK